jgi:hypothetical protein
MLVENRMFHLLNQVNVGLTYSNPGKNIAQNGRLNLLGMQQVCQSYRGFAKTSTDLIDSNYQINW